MSEIKTKVCQSNGAVTIKNDLWVTFNEKMEQFEYNRLVSKIQKDVKTIIYDLKRKNEWDINYFVDIDIRDSPSTNAFLSINLNIVKNNKQTLQTKIIKHNIIEYLNFHKQFKPFINIKKRKVI